MRLAQDASRYDEPNDPALKWILCYAHLTLHLCLDHHKKYVEEDQWRISLTTLVTAITNSEPGATTSTYALGSLWSRDSTDLSCRADKDTSNNVLRVLGLEKLRAVKPDVIVGLAQKLVVVRAREGESPLLGSETRDGLHKYILSRRVSSEAWIGSDVLFENSEGMVFLSG